MQKPSPVPTKPIHMKIIFSKSQTLTVDNTFPFNDFFNKLLTLGVTNTIQ